MKFEWDDEFLDECADLIAKSRRVVKQAHYDMGRKILSDPKFKNLKYGEKQDYYAQLSAAIRKKHGFNWGYRTLRYCVEFALYEPDKLSKPTTRELIENPKVKWKWIINNICTKSEICNKLQFLNLISDLQSKHGVDLEPEVLEDMKKTFAEVWAKKKKKLRYSLKRRTRQSYLLRNT